MLFSGQKREDINMFFKESFASFKTFIISSTTVLNSNDFEFEKCIISLTDTKLCVCIQAAYIVWIREWHFPPSFLLLCEVTLH